MAEIMLALARTFANLRSGRVWLYVLTPALCALLLTIALAVWGLGWLAGQLLALPPMTWLAAWGLVWLATFLACWAAGWRSSLLPIWWLRCSRRSSSCRCCSSICRKRVTATWRCWSRQLRRRYAQQPGGGAIVCAAVGADDSLVADSRPVPVVPLLLMAWLNRRTFAYDALFGTCQRGGMAGVVGAPQRAVFCCWFVHGAARARAVAGACLPPLWQRWHSSTTVWRACAVCGRRLCQASGVRLTEVALCAQCSAGRRQPLAQAAQRR